MLYIFVLLVALGQKTLVSSQILVIMALAINSVSSGAILSNSRCVSSLCHSEKFLACGIIRLIAVVCFMPPTDETTFED